MPTRRQRKIEELLHEEISGLIQYETQDPRLGFVTITGVDITPDLRQAEVYFSVLGDDEAAKETLAGLTSAAGYFRHKLGQSLSLRHIPNLVFKLDRSLEHGLRIENLLDQIKEEETDLAENSTEAESND